MGDWKRADLIELGHSSAEKQASRWFFCIAEWVILIFHFCTWQHQAGQAPHLGSGQPQQNLYHPGALTGTPPSLPPGPSAQSPQSSFPQPAAVYAIHPHQQLPHGFTNMAHVTQVGCQGIHCPISVLVPLCSALLIRDLQMSCHTGY